MSSGRRAVRCVVVLCMIEPALAFDGSGVCLEYPNRLGVVQGTGELPIAMPTVLRTGECLYEMWFNSHSPPGYGAILHATSADGIIWSNEAVALTATPGAWDDIHVYNAAVIKDGGTYKMWYTGYGGQSNQIGYATSTDGVNWAKDSGNPVVTLGSWDSQVVRVGSVIYDVVEEVYKMWYSGGSGWFHPLQVGYASSPDGITWTKHPSPVFVYGSTVEWVHNHVSVIAIETGYEMYFSSSAGDIRLATSADGLNWALSECAPVVEPSVTGWDTPIVADACVLYVDGIRKLWYRGGDGTATGIGFSLPAPAHLAGDTNGDCDVDVVDFLMVLGQWGLRCP